LVCQFTAKLKDICDGEMTEMLRSCDEMDSTPAGRQAQRQPIIRPKYGGRLSTKVNVPVKQGAEV